MKTITLPVCNRASYLKEVIESIKQNNLTGYKLYIGAEPGYNDVIDLCKSIDFIEKTIVINDAKLGVRKNPYLTLKRAFDDGSVFNFHIEDDIVFSPDAVSLMNWYYDNFKNNPTAFGYYGLFNYNSNDSDESSLIKVNKFTGYGWGVFKENWDDLFNKWWFDDSLCLKKYKAYGWDWAVTTAMEEFGYFGLIPSYSRSNHIGRDGGVHCIASDYDKVFTKIKYNKTLRIDNFNIVE